jgi:hypothetical protein
VVGGAVKGLHPTQEDVAQRPLTALTTTQARLRNHGSGSHPAMLLPHVKALYRDLRLPDVDPRPRTTEARWGHQLDIRPIHPAHLVAVEDQLRATDRDGPTGLGRGQIAGYLAEYATPRTVRKVVQTFGKLMAAAIDARLINASPADRVRALQVAPTRAHGQAMRRSPCPTSTRVAVVRGMPGCEQGWLTIHVEASLSGLGHDPGRCSDAGSLHASTVSRVGLPVGYLPHMTAPRPLNPGRAGMSTAAGVTCSYAARSRATVPRY